MITPTISNLLALTSGALIASGVAGAILLARDHPKPEHNDLLSDRKAREMSPPYRNTIPDESLVAQFQRLSSTSHTLLNRLALEKRLDEIPIAGIGDFITGSKDQLTRAQRAQAYTHLLVRWAKKDPAEAMKCLLDLNVEALVQPLASTPCLTELVCREWLEKDQKQFQSWLIGHWGDENLTRNPLRDSIGNRSTYQQLMGVYLMDQLRSEIGFAAGLEVLKEFPHQAYPSLMPALGSAYGSRGGPVPKERIAPLYELFQTIPPGPERAQAGSFVWKNWMEADPKDAEKAMAMLASPRELEARLALIPEPGGFGVKEKSNSKFEMGDQFYQPGSLKEEVAIETAIQQGLSSAEAVVLIARQRLAMEASSSGHMYQWLGQVSALVNLDRDLFEAGQRLIPNPEIENSNGDYHRAIMLASFIKDPGLRQEATGQTYRNFLRDHPAEAEDLLGFNHFSSGFVAELKQTRDGGKQ